MDFDTHNTTKIETAEFLMFFLVGRFDGGNVAEGREKNWCPSQTYVIIIVM